MTQAPGGEITLEPINDCSGVTFYGGLYHIWHQCCQNHWDHVISKDLIHWQRLPPPIQPVTLKTWDGSITILYAQLRGKTEMLLCLVFCFFFFILLFFFCF